MTTVARKRDRQRERERERPNSSSRKRGAISKRDIRETIGTHDHSWLIDDDRKDDELLQEVFSEPAVVLSPPLPVLLASLLLRTTEFSACAGIEAEVESSEGLGERTLGWMSKNVWLEEVKFVISLLLLDSFWLSRFAR